MRPVLAALAVAFGFATIPKFVTVEDADIVTKSFAAAESADIVTNEPVATENTAKTTKKVEIVVTIETWNYLQAVSNLATAFKFATCSSIDEVIYYQWRYNEV